MIQSSLCAKIQPFKELRYNGFRKREREKQLMARKCGALRNLVAFVQFKKREKHPWRSVKFSKVPGFSLQLY